MNPTTKHSKLRAEQRYSLSNFNGHAVIKSIRNDDCIWIKNSAVNNSKIFFLQYYNKYIKVVTDNELAEKLKFFSQALGNGVKSGCVLSRTRPDFQTPMVGFEKPPKFVNFWVFPHPLITLQQL